MPVYEVNHLTKYYPQQATPANDDLTFTVETGEVFGLLGANGAGKTTLVKQLANLLAPTSGTIRLMGKTLTDDPLYTPSRIGYMPQSVHALNTLTVAETLYFTAHLRGLSRREARAERDRLLDRFGLGRLDYFATLPIHRSALILATVFAFLALSLPPTLTTLAAGSLILRLPLVLSPWALVVVPLTSVSLSGLGALLGLVGRTPQEVDSLNLLTTLILFGFGPVVIPPDRLPALIVHLSALSPATYAASAIRQAVLGWSDRLPLALDLAVLSALSIVLLWLVSQRMEWREC